MFTATVILLLFFGFLIYKNQEHAILFAKKLPQDWIPTINYRHEEIFVEIKDKNKDLKLNAILFKATRNVKNSLVLYYHGNSGNMKSVEDYAISFLENGFDILVMDYRGFGKSEGIINKQEDLLDDCVFWYDWIKSNKEYKEIVIVGKSLGTGLATYVASKRESNMLMLITPYDKLIEVGKNLYPWFPVNFFMKYKIPSINWIGQVNQPIRIIHGTNDETIHPQRAKALFEKALELGKNVEMVWLDAAKHNNLQMYPQYHEWIKNCLEESEKFNQL